jgi:soluble lytic murein transglycosylase-like protein
MTHRINDLLAYGRTWSAHCVPRGNVSISLRRHSPAPWRPGPDYRVICDCQRAHRHRRRWRALRIASHGAAVLGVALIALLALDPPSEAMSINLDALQGSIVQRLKTATTTTPTTTIGPAPLSSLPVFTTPEVRKHFLEADTKAPSPTLDVFKREFFRVNVPYGAIIYREARKNRLLPELVAAMVETESDFRPRLVSEKSALGLMQIVPDTAKTLGIADPFNPEQNIAAGTRYFRYLLDKFDNNESFALAAYNAGEGTVERFGGIPPFPETRDYVARVNGRTKDYRLRVSTNYLAAVRINGSGHLPRSR